MDAICWSDYLCPWCYVGQARSAQMAALGVPVVHRPFELHPEIPPSGRPVRPDGRLAPTFARVAAECEAAGLPFVAPTRMPNTRRALETAEWVRIHQPDAFDALHTALFDAHFALGLALDDPEVLDALVLRAGGDPAAARDAVDSGAASALVDASMAEAADAGVTSTPTWVLSSGLAIPGVLDAATLDRWVRRILEKAS